MDSIKIKGYKSIKDATIELKAINILIGANGSGKSNFISFFEFLNRLYNRKLQEYVALNGGMTKVLYNGVKETKDINARLIFNEGINEYSFSISHNTESFVFNQETLWYNKNPWNISGFNFEAKIKIDDSYRAKHIRKHLQSFRKYHFHDTGKSSPFNEMSHIENDIYFLYETGKNLAAFLYNIQEKKPIIYNRIIKIIQSIAPYFSDFYLQPNSEGYIRLQWQDKYSSTVYGTSDLSDGTIRFIALTTIFMQPNLPSTIIIDEPELGLHPFAISKLTGMIQSVENKDTQVIIATQSSDLVSYFTPEDVITVDLENGESVFKRLDTKALSVWIEDYSLGDLWKRNIIQTGQP